MLESKTIETLKPNSSIIDIIKCYDYKTKNGKVKILGNTNLNLQIIKMIRYYFHLLSLRIALRFFIIILSWNY